MSSWALCHYGYPVWLDIWSPDFAARCGEFAAAAAKVIRDESGQAPLVCPMNEISFWSWLGGKEGKIAPYTIDHGDELKRVLVRATISAIPAIREVDTGAKIYSAEPLINVVPDTLSEEDILAARLFHWSQYEAIDLVLGRIEPELGGFENAIDVIGVNYYPHNQWRIRGRYIPTGHHDYKPFSELLWDVHERYQRPQLLAETGAEYSARSSWLNYVCGEVRDAMKKGVPITGICIYPITDYPGWDNDRICNAGLFGSIGEAGTRTVYEPLAQEVYSQSEMFSTITPKALSNVIKLVTRQ